MKVQKSENTLWFDKMEGFNVSDLGFSILVDAVTDSYSIRVHGEETHTYLSAEEYNTILKVFKLEERE